MENQKVSLYYGNRACWNFFCIASDCNGKNHVDPTGYTWEQNQGEIYNPETDRHERVEPEE